MQIRSRQWTGRAWSRAARIILLALVLASCAALDPRVVNDAVGEFHQHFNADDWSAIYDAADASFRAATPRDSFMRAMTALKSKSGTLDQSEQRSYVVQAQAGDSSGTFVRATYASKFAQKTATETFAWRIEGGRALLFFYDAR